MDSHAARRGWAGEGRVLAALALLALLARLVPFVVAGPERHATRGYLYYEEMADNALAGRGLYRTMPYGQGDRFAIRTPGYPLLLAGLKRLPGAFAGKVALCGAIFGASSVLLAAWLARRAFGARAGLAAGAGLALWPAACVHDAALQDTAMYSALLLAFVAACWRLADRAAARAAPMAAVGVGLLGAAGILVRVTLLLPVLALAAWLAWRAAAGASRRVGLAVLLLLGVAAGLAPWLARNARVVGAPILTSDTGRSLWLGNNPETFSVYPEQSIDRAEERAWAALAPEDREHVRSLAGDERAQDAWFRARALAWMAGHPVEAVAGFARKALATFSPWMSPRAGGIKQAVHLVTWALALALGALGAWRARGRLADLGPAWIPVVLVALHSGAFFGHSSYRAYADALVIVFAAGAASRVLERVRTPCWMTRAAVMPAWLGLALLPRIAMLMLGGELVLPERPWERGYEVGAVARALADGRGFADPFDGGEGLPAGPPFFARTGPTAVVGPLLPVAWAGVIRGTGDEALAWRLVLLLAASASAAIAPLLAMAGARLGHARAGLIAALAWALHPGAVLASRSLLPSVFPLLATWALVEIMSVHAATMLEQRVPGIVVVRAGVALGASAWAEPLLFPCAAAWCAWCLLRLRRGGLPAAATLALALALVSPWMIRNALVVGTPSLRSWAGPELLLGAVAGPGDPTPIRLHPTRSGAEMARLAEAGEATYTREAASRAIARIRDAPGRWIAACAWRWGAFWLGRASWWRPADHPLLGGAPSALRGPLHALVAMLAAAGLARLARSRHALWSLLALVMLLYPVTYALTHVEARYRLPLEPLLLFVAALGLARPRGAAALDASASSEHDSSPPEDASA